MFSAQETIDTGMLEMKNEIAANEAQCHTKVVLYFNTTDTNSKAQAFPTLRLELFCCILSLFNCMIFVLCPTLCDTFPTSMA